VSAPKELFKVGIPLDRLLYLEQAAQERDEAVAAVAGMREALDSMMGAARYAHETGDFSAIPDAYNRCEELLARNDSDKATLEYIRGLEAKVELAKEALSNFLWVNVDDGPKERIPDCDKARAAYVALGGVIPEPDDDEEDDDSDPAIDAYLKGGGKDA
jgi:hypothetical protein